MTLDPNQPAFPQPRYTNDDSKTPPGLTKREHIALEMMKAWRIANPHIGSNDARDGAMHDAYALIEALNREAGK